jgi:membrane-associated phospholipid phosphatase/8-oxo-dGTP pyrophosphatase MutT (NUDIX family)
MKAKKPSAQSSVLPALISFWLLITPLWAQDYKGAACIIFVDDEIVLVRDFLSNRLSFPGGYIHQGESPEQAAQRETYEEIGLPITVGPQIGTANQSAQYLCRSDTPVPVLSTQGFEFKSIVYASSAPDFSVEIRQVYLIAPKSMGTEELRFPNQLKLLPDFKQYPEWQSHSVALPDHAIPISRLHQIELKAISRLQSCLAPHADLLFRLFNFMGENAAFFILVPIIWAYSGWQMGIRCIVLLIISAELNNVLKVIFAQPRPFHLMPQLQRMEGSGFGLPSGHALVATVFWGYCWHSFKHLLPIQKQRIGFVILILMLIGCALARVYWGVHFFSDVIIGAGLGLLILSLFIHFEKTGPWHQIAFVKKPPWAIGFIVITTAAFFTPGSLSSQLGGLTLGLYLGLCFGRTQALHEKIAINKLGKLSLAGLGIVGIMLLDRTAKAIVSQQADSIVMMVAYFVSYLLIGLWLTVGMYLLPLCKNRVKSLQ